MLSFVGLSQYSLCWHLPKKEGMQHFMSGERGKSPQLLKGQLLVNHHLIPSQRTRLVLLHVYSCCCAHIIKTSKNHSLFYLNAVHYVNWAIIEIISKCLHVSKWFQMSTHSRSPFLPLFLLRLLKSVLDRLGRLWQSIRFPGCEFRHHSRGWNRLGNQPGAELQGRASEHVCVASFSLKQWYMI